MELSPPHARQPTSRRAPYRSLYYVKLKRPLKVFDSNKLMHAAFLFIYQETTQCFPPPHRRALKKTPKERMVVFLSFFINILRKLTGGNTTSGLLTAPHSSWLTNAPSRVNCLKEYMCDSQGIFV
jgi:hypothetical protein